MFALVCNILSKPNLVRTYTNAMANVASVKLGKAFSLFRRKRGQIPQ